MKKNCTICKNIKSFQDFYPHKLAKDGLQSHCKKCHDILTKNWRNKNLERRRKFERIRMRKYRKENPEKVKEIAQRTYRKNREVLLERKRKHCLEIKKEILNKYGMKCACCGENRFQFLSLDHINGNGNKERKKIKRSGSGYYAYMKKNNYYPKHLQILCFNCNMAKAFYKICPHQLDRKVID